MSIFVTVERRTIFGDVQEVIIMLYARALVDEGTGEVNIGCELKSEPIF